MRRIIIKLIRLITDNKPIWHREEFDGREQVVFINWELAALKIQGAQSQSEV